MKQGLIKPREDMFCYTNIGKEIVWNLLFGTMWSVCLIKVLFPLPHAFNIMFLTLNKNILTILSCQC